MTVYPDWDGNLRASPVDIALKWGMQFVRRRPLIEVLERRMTNRSPERGGVGTASLLPGFVRARPEVRATQTIKGDAESVRRRAARDKHIKAVI